MTTTPAPAPALNGLVIGQAERATRAVLDRLLAGHDTPFETWVVVNLIARADGPIEADDLAAQLRDGLRVSEAEAVSAIDDARHRGLATGTDALGLTPAGRDRFTVISAGIAAVTARLYADLPTADLEAAARVLLTVTGRARAELAS
jgi:hypothetical protein